MAIQFGRNHSLCHGDLGNIDLLLQASEVFNDTQLKVEANKRGGMILESLTQDGWMPGIPLGVETPGLMTGIAGIGYGLLRLAIPDYIPSVLLLAPPITNKL